MATPNNVERGWLALAFTCQNSFNFLRFVMGTAAFSCSILAIFYHVSVLDAKNKVTKRDAKFSEILAEIGTAVCIMFLPFAMLGRHILICKVVPGLDRQKARCCRFGMRITTLLMTSLTMLESATATAIEVAKKDELKMVALVLSSIILCEGALLAEDNYGVFELALTFFVVQFIKAFPKLDQPYLYGIIFLVYVGRGSVMYSMKKMNEKVRRQTRREVGAKKGQSRVEELRETWNTTNGLLRRNHRINVVKDLPSFVRMNVIIDAMMEEENDNTANLVRGEHDDT